MRSKNHLQALTANKEILCLGMTYDDYDRRIATCFAGTQNLNLAMVRDGHAFAYSQYSQAYVAPETEARLAGRGVWAGPSEPPWEYRKTRWQAAGQTAPEGCPIKGNISKRGRIYHTPWSRSYSRTRINEAAGERWFCSEMEALAAGWRPPSG